MVYVLNVQGKPIMPCKSAKARKLLRGGKATVIKRVPLANAVVGSLICVDSMAALLTKAVMVTKK